MRSAPAAPAEGTAELSRGYRPLRFFLPLIATAFGLTFLALSLHAQAPTVLDHVVAVINGGVLLQSDVNEELAYSVLQPFGNRLRHEPPQAALERLIDRALILQQMKLAENTIPPTAEEVQASIQETREFLPDCAHDGCNTEAGWQAYLAAHQLNEDEVKTRWAQRLSILAFIQSRFGSGVRITPAEVAAYYNKTLLPLFAGRTVQPPTLTAVSPRITEILLQQRVSSLLLDWLQSLKSEGSVSILDPLYGKLGTTGTGDEQGGQP